MGRPGLIALLAALLVQAPLTGCDRSPPGPPPPPVAVTTTPRPTTPDPVVARVNGRPILASDLQLALKPKRTVRQALRGAIVRELLAQEAQRRRLDRSPEVINLQRKAMVATLLKRRFHDNFSIDSIPGDLVRKAYKANRHFFVHPELVEVSHIVAMADKEAPAARRQRARELADTIARLAATGPLTRDGFEALATHPEAKDPSVTLKVERITTPKRGKVVDAFADAAFAMNRSGQISPVVPTIYGFHVIYYVERRPARDDSLERVESDVRQRILEESRGHVLRRWLKKQEKNAKVERFDHRLGGSSHSNPKEPT